MSSKLIKVVLQYEDKVLTLDGDKAANFDNVLKGLSNIALTHGYGIPDLGWVVTQKKEIEDNGKRTEVFTEGKVSEPNQRKPRETKSKDD